ncbi:MAG: transposase [Verrucomicrobia bacterium]|nr:transposase [Verrucomicrobiota bacterium]
MVNLFTFGHAVPWSIASNLPCTSASQEVKGINKLSKVIDWELFREELESILGYARRDWSKGGRPPFDPVLMFKVLVLQKFYAMSSASFR